MIRRAVGSNQYRARSSSALAPATGPDLMAQAAGATPVQRLRCGEVWGTKCQSWVTPPDFTHGQHGLAGDRVLLAANPDCPSWALPMLAQDPDPAVRCMLAANPQLGIDEVRLLATDPIADVRAQAISHPACADHLTLLQAGSRDPDPQVRMAALLSPQLPPEAVASLAQDPDQAVRCAAVMHPACTPPMQISAIQLDAADSSSNEPTDVISQLLVQPHLHESVLREMVKHMEGEGAARYVTIAGHPSCPVDVLVQLSQSSNDSVRRAAVSKLPANHELVLRATHPNDLYGLVPNLGSGQPYPSQVFTAVWNIADSDSRIRILDNRACPPSVLRLACRDASVAVRTAAVQHWACPPDEINTLVDKMLRTRGGFDGEANYTLAKYALAHSGCTQDCLQRVYDEQVTVAVSGPLYNERARQVNAILTGITTNPECPAQIIRETLRLYEQDVERSSYGHTFNTAIDHALRATRCPPDVLWEAVRYDKVRSAATLLRLRVTDNPNCPPEMVVHLLGDTVTAVRDKALRHPNCPQEYRMLAQMAR